MMKEATQMQNKSSLWFTVGAIITYVWHFDLFEMKIFHLISNDPDTTEELMKMLSIWPLLVSALLRITNELIWGWACAHLAQFLPKMLSPSPCRSDGTGFCPRARWKKEIDLRVFPNFFRRRLFFVYLLVIWSPMRTVSEVEREFGVLWNQPIQIRQSMAFKKATPEVLLYAHVSEHWTKHPYV